MVVCTGGSESKVDTPRYVQLGKDSFEGLLLGALPWMKPFLPYLDDIVLDTDAFCSLDPPSLPTLDATDLFALITRDKYGLAAAIGAKFAQLVHYFAWYSLCQCTTGGTPSPTSSVSAPTDIPVFNPPLTTVGNLPGAVLADNPIHYWRLADPAGSHIARDLGSRHIDLLPVPAGLPESPAGYTGPSSNGGSWFCLVGYWRMSSMAPIAAPFTIECWIWTPFEANGNFVTLDSSASSATFGFQQVGFTARTFNAVQGGAALGTSGPLNRDTWYHLAVTHSSSGSVFYLNGSSVASNGLAVNASNMTAFCLSASTTSLSPTTAFLSEVAIFPSVLSAGRIAAHYAAADQPSIRPSYRGQIIASSPQIPQPPRFSTDSSLLTLVQRQAVPFGYIQGTVHTGLTGHADLTVADLIGLAVALTTIPASYGETDGSPITRFDLGWVRWGTADGWTERRRIDSNGLIWLPPNAGAYTLISYTLAPGIVATITELVREP